MNETNETIAGVGMDDTVAATDASGRGPDCLDDVRACLLANHANTLALLACLRVCDAEEGGLPYRDAEDRLAQDSALSLSLQTPHTLLGLLVKAGGLERVDIPDPETTTAGSSDAQHSGDSISTVGAPSPNDAPACREPAAQGADQSGVPVDSEPPTITEGTHVLSPAQPVDYLLRITQAGRTALAEFDPVARFADLVAAEPDGYLDAYALVLDTCAAEGASLRTIERALAGHPALREPKRIYPAYFVSKLETVGALAWEDGAWHTTSAGERALSSLAQAGPR